MDKGKAKMSAEEMRREEEARILRERIDKWLESQKGLEVRPPVPTHYQSQPQPYIRGPEARRPPVLPNCPQGFSEHPEPYPTGSSNQKAAEPASPEYTPASPYPDLFIVTDLVSKEALDFYWENRKVPVFPDVGPWFRFDQGYVRFRYGMSWERLDKLEREAAIRRQEARARGEKVLSQPLPKQPGEIMLRIIDLEERPASPVALPAPPAPPPQNEDHDIDADPDDPNEWGVNDFDMSSSDSNEEGEDQELPDWSDTSTLTEEPTMVPLTLRRLLEFRRRRR